MKTLLEEYFVFIMYVITGMLVIGLFVDIVEGPALNYGIQNDAERDELSIHQQYENIDINDVYFNILGRPLAYGTNFDWRNFVIFDDGQPYINENGTENMLSEHCFAIINGQKIDLTKYVTPANYTNTTQLEIDTHYYLNEKPKESEAKIEIVPYVLNWENIHIKKNVAYFVLPNNMLMTFYGRAFHSDGKTPFKNKRILYRKGETEMAVSETDANGYFVIGIKNESLPEDLNNQNIMPLGDYTFIIEAEGSVFQIVFSEDTFNDQQTTYNLGNISFK